MSDHRELQAIAAGTVVAEGAVIMRLLSSAFLGAFALSLVAGCGGSSSPLGGGNDSNGKSSSGTSTGDDGSSSSSGGKDSSSGGSDSSSSSGGGSGSSSGSSSGHKLVFVTSVAYPGDLGGSAGADADCQTAANAQALGGTFKAWISTPDEDAIDRITDVGPWYTTSKYASEKAFNNKSNLLTIPLADLVYTESGDYASWSGYSSLWTGTGVDGRFTGYACNGWIETSNEDYGTTGNGNDAQGWGGSDSSFIGCDSSNALICIEQ